MQDATPQDVLCPICHERHVLAVSYSVKYPHATMDVAKEDIERRIVMTADECVIDNAQFFLRGRIPIPIQNPGGEGFLPEPFIWGVWAEVSPKNFIRSNELWRAEGREAEPPFLGYLNNELSLYGPTLNLEVDVHTQPVGRRPHFTVVDTTHPIAVEQREGLTLQRIEEIAITMAHPAGAVSSAVVR
jgi:hypothetical protein